MTSSADAAVWVGDAAGDRVFRAPATTPEDVEVLPVPAPVTGIAAGQGGVWVTSAEADTVTLLDEVSGSVLTSLDVAENGCDGPDAIAAGADAVWVACRASEALVRIDPETRTVTGSLGVDGAPTALTVDDDGVVWLAVGPA